MTFTDEAVLELPETVTGRKGRLSNPRWISRFLFGGAIIERK
jgi:hypothetical protein